MTKQGQRQPLPRVSFGLGSAQDTLLQSRSCGWVFCTGFNKTCTRLVRGYTGVIKLTPFLAGFVFISCSLYNWYLNRSGEESVLVSHEGIHPNSRVVTSCLARRASEPSCLCLLPIQGTTDVTSDGCCKTCEYWRSHH